MLTFFIKTCAVTWNSRFTYILWLTLTHIQELYNALLCQYSLVHKQLHTHFNGISRSPRTQRGRGRRPRQREAFCYAASPPCGFRAWVGAQLCGQPRRFSPKLLFLPWPQGGRPSPSGSQRRPGRTCCLKLSGKPPSGLRVCGHRQLTKHTLTLTGVTRSP